MVLDIRAYTTGIKSIEARVSKKRTKGFRRLDGVTRNSITSTLIGALHLQTNGITDGTGARWNCICRETVH